MKWVHFGEGDRCGEKSGRWKEGRGGRDETTIKQLKRAVVDGERDEMCREMVRTKKGDATGENKRGEEHGGDSNASRTRGPCSPGHSGPQTRNTFLRIPLRGSQVWPIWIRLIHRYRYIRLGPYQVYNKLKNACSGKDNSYRECSNLYDGRWSINRNICSVLPSYIFESRKDILCSILYVYSTRVR